MDSGFNDTINFLEDKIYKQDAAAESVDFTIDFESAKKNTQTK
ncbi:hypothetical protein [Chryseobacterium sp.]|nr:hypothetical protein [Chryseobacterium sp.]